MQERQVNRQQYFNELALSSEKYFVPYITRFKKLSKDMRVLEIGCGDGGNLVPFAKMECSVLGVDMSPSRIETARKCFAELGLQGDFIAADIFTVKELEHQFDLIICHDVLEHIPDKMTFVNNLKKYTKPDGVVFMSFPAWQMPFGGHQQICHSKLLSHLPFYHILPRPLYKAILKIGGEPQDIIAELMNIKSTRCPIEKFERIVRVQQLQVMDRRFYFINPHYEVKFHLKPRRLTPLIGCIPWLRNFFTTSCFYILDPNPVTKQESQIGH